MLVVLQLLVFVTYIFGPTAALGEEPTPDPTPVETIAPDPAPEPTPEPTPSEEPATDEPSAPAPEEPSAPAEEPSAPVEPTIWTGKDDYVPTEFVDLYGEGFGARPSPGRGLRQRPRGQELEPHRPRSQLPAEPVPFFYEFRLAGTTSSRPTRSWPRATSVWCRGMDLQRTPSLRASSSSNSNSGSGSNGQQADIECAGDRRRAEVAIAQVVVHKDFQNRLICPPSGWTSILKTFRGAISRPPFTCRRPSSARRPLSHSRRTGAFGSPTARPAVLDASGFGASGGVIVYSGVDTTDPIRSAVGANGPSGGTKNAPGTGAAAVGDMVVRFIGNGRTKPSGRSRLRRESTPVGSSNQTQRTAAAFAATHATGATAGTFTFTSTGEWTAQTVVLRMGGASKLAFTTPAHTGAVNACLGPITAQTENASNVATNRDVRTITVNLASDSDGARSSATTACTTFDHQGRGPDREPAATPPTFYYKATARGDARSP